MCAPASMAATKASGSTDDTHTWFTHPSNRQDLIGNLSQTYIGSINSKVKERFSIRSHAFLKPHCWVVLKNWKRDDPLIKLLGQGQGS
jgi:hypothetical protein